MLVSVRWLMLVFLDLLWTVARLPDSAEYARATACASSGQYLDVTARTISELLPPCISQCYPGLAAIYSQCVWRATGSEVMRLRFEFRGRCSEAECEWIHGPHSTPAAPFLQLLGMKVAQFFGVPLEEVQAAMLAWPELETNSPELRLDKFLVVRRDEPEFDRSRRMSAQDRMHQWSIAFRVDSDRILPTHHPVRYVVEKRTEFISSSIGIPVTVHNTEITSSAPDNLPSDLDFSTLYQFNGYLENQNPFEQSGVTIRPSPNTCLDPCYRFDEQKSNNHCVTDCDCTSERWCSPAGTCFGDIHGCSLPSPPGYLCSPGLRLENNNEGGARLQGTSFDNCARSCDAAPTCGALQWWTPAECFLVGSRSPAVYENKKAEAGHAYVCIRAPTTTVAPAATSTIAVALVSSPCLSRLTTILKQAGLQAFMDDCWTDSSGARCAVMACFAIQAVAKIAACKSDLCSNGNQTVPTTLWQRSCTNSKSSAAFQTERSQVCLNADSNVPQVREGKAVYDGKTEDGGGDRGNVQLGLILVLFGIPIFCLIGVWSVWRIIVLLCRGRLDTEAVRNHSKSCWSEDTGSWSNPKAQEPQCSWEQPPQLNQPFGCPRSFTTGTPNETKAPRLQRSASSPVPNDKWWPQSGTSDRSYSSATECRPQGTGGQRAAQVQAETRENHLPSDLNRSFPSAGGPRAAGIAIDSTSRVSFGKVPNDATGSGATVTSSSRSSDGAQRRWLPSANSSESCSSRADGASLKKGHEATSNRGVGDRSTLPQSTVTPKLQRCRSEPPRSRSISKEQPMDRRIDTVPTHPTALTPSTLIAELDKLRTSSLAERKRYFQAQCLRWHPDKNVGDEIHATRMFQILQDKKAWFLDC